MGQRKIVKTILATRQWLRSFAGQFEVTLRRYPKATIISMLVICAVIMLWRRPEAIIQAQFWAEDGKYWYADAYNQGWSSLLATYGGYFVLMYRFVAMISLTLPFHQAPEFFNLTALGFQLLPVLLLCSSRLKSIMPYRSVGILLSLLYVSLPNNSEVFTNLTNIQWHLGVAALLVLLAQPSKKLLWRLFDYAILIATGLSGPMVVILAPISLFLFWRHRTKRYRNMFLLLAGLSVIQIIGIFFLSGVERVGVARPNFYYFIQMITGQIFIGGLLGQDYVNVLYGNFVMLFVIFTLGITLITYAVIKGPEWLKIAIAYSILLITAMLISLKPVPGFDPWQGLVNPGGGQRYWYIPILVWIVTLVWLAFRATVPALKKFSIIGLCLLLLIGIPTDWRIQVWPYQDFQTHATRFEQSPPGTVTHIPVNPGWEMVLTKR